MIANLIARLKCWRYGHKRGKRIEKPADMLHIDAHDERQKGVVFFACPRCTATWTRKAKVA